MIGIVDYGSGNVRSVANALSMIGAEARLCSTPEQLGSAERLVLPGVGAFGHCIDSLRARGFDRVLETLVMRERRPILGICVGMQLMARSSTEGGAHAGLGWFDAGIERLAPAAARLRVPQVGWNAVEHREPCALFADVPQQADLYFVHSYWMRCRHDNDVVAWCDYDGRVTAAVQRDNIVATQFHPEKSQDFGLAILHNFVRWTPD